MFTKKVHLEEVAVGDKLQQLESSWEQMKSDSRQLNLILAQKAAVPEKEVPVKSHHL